MSDFVESFKRFSPLQKYKEQIIQIKSTLK